MVEHATVNRRAVGSSPTRGAIIEPDFSQRGVWFFSKQRLANPRKTASDNKKITVSSEAQRPRPPIFGERGLFFR